MVQDAGGGLQTQPEQSLRCMHFHQQSFVVFLRRESIPEGESDKSFIAQRLAINPVPVIFFVTTLKTLPLVSFPCNTEASTPDFQRSLESSAITCCVVRSCYFRGIKDIFCSILLKFYQHAECLSFPICSLVLMNFREIICEGSACVCEAFALHLLALTYYTLLLNTSPPPSP